MYWSRLINLAIIEFYEENRIQHMCWYILETTSKQAWHNGHNIGGSRTLKYEPILPVLWWCQSQAWRKEEEGDVKRPTALGLSILPVFLLPARFYCIWLTIDPPAAEVRI